MKETVVGTALGLAFALLLFVSGIEFGRLTFKPCHEDQAYVVAIDRNPDHGLTWVCRSLDEVGK